MKTVFLRMLPYAIFLGLSAASPSPLFAAAPASYSATMAKTTDTPRSDIVEGTMWRCTTDICTGADEGQRPSYICRQVMRKFGPVARFSSSKGELTAAELAKCNALK
jgi:hypothetical protein